MESLFSDKSRFRLIDKKSTLIWLSSIQRYLCTLFDRGEINKDQFKNLRHKNAIVAPVHALPKLHKSYTYLCPFCLIVDTKPSCFYNMGSFLTELLTPVAHCEVTLNDSSDVASKTRNISPQLFDNDYIFASFDMTSLFTNVPLNRTFNVVLDCVYNENLVNINLRKRTLKMRIKGICSNSIYGKQEIISSE